MFTYRIVVPQFRYPRIFSTNALVSWLMFHNWEGLARRLESRVSDYLLTNSIFLKEVIIYSLFFWFLTLLRWTHVFLSIRSYVYLFTFFIFCCFFVFVCFFLSLTRDKFVDDDIILFRKTKCFPINFMSLGYLMSTI
jgi:hypothetical protein